MVQRSARLGEARLGETRLGEGSFQLERQIGDATTVVDNVFPDLILRTIRPSDTISVADDVFTEFILRKIGLSDTINTVDDPRYETFLHRFADDSQPIGDDLFRKYILHRFGDDTTTLVDEPRYETFLHRFIDDTTTLVDDPRYEFILHLLLDDTQNILDEIFINFVFPPIQLSDKVFAVDTTNFDEVFWDKSYFDQKVFLFTTLDKRISDIINVVDEARYITFLHRFNDDTIPVLDNIERLIIRLKTLADTTNVVDKLQLTFILNQLLSDTVFIAEESRFDQTFFDGAPFDQRVQLIFDLVRQFSDTSTVLDDIRYTTFLHRFGDDTQAIVDEIRYTTFLHRFGDDTQAVLDELFTELSLIKTVALSDIIFPAGKAAFDETHWDKIYFDQDVQLIFDLIREFSDTQPVVDDLFRKYILHRFGDDSTTVVDDLFRKYILHRFGDDIITILDDIESLKELFKTVRLSDLAFVSGEARFDEITWDGGLFDQRVQLVFDYVRVFADTITLLDAVRAFFDIGIILELEDFIDFESFFDTAEFDEHHFDSEGDRIRITYILHRFFAELLATADDVVALREAIRRLADATTLIDTFFVFEGGLIIPPGSILRLHRLGAVENALLLFPLDVGVDQSERAEAIEIPFADTNVLQATGTSAKRIRIVCLWVENGDQDEESLKDNLTALQNADEIKVTFFLQKLLTKNYQPVKLETFSVQKVRGRSDILRVRLVFIEDTN